MGKFSKLAVALFLSAVFFFGSVESFSSHPYFKVRWVDDGDTVILEDNRHVRYSGINAPEKGNGSKPGELFGKEAFEFNRNLVLSKKVRLESDLEEKDRYGRILAYVYLSDNTFVNLRMIETGHAFVLYQKPNIKYYPILLQAQQKAMISEKGIWTALKEDDGIQYVGNRNSKRFHKVSCPLGKKIRPDHHLFFKSKRDAFWEGYSPCRECSPALFVTPS